MAREITWSSSCGKVKSKVVAATGSRLATLKQTVVALFP